MKDYRNQFPFLIGTTSFILKQSEDNLIVNVEYLKDHFDKLQLLFFGKNFLNEVASPPILKKLYQLKQGSPIQYAVHLPIDMYLMDCEFFSLENNIDAIEHIIEITRPLDINEFILHIEHAKPVPNDRERFRNILERLSVRLGSFNSNIFLENTYYDLTGVKDIIFKSPHPICMDLGHLFINNLDPINFISSFNDRIHEVHLHGCAGGKDHISLRLSDKVYIEKVIKYLKTYKHSVILEVFNETDLMESMEYLEGGLNFGRF